MAARRPARARVADEASIGASTSAPMGTWVATWVATALLHRERPARADFTPKEIELRAQREGLSEPRRRSFGRHANNHAGAGRNPESDRYRLLHASARGRLRLYRRGDSRAPGRQRGRTAPTAYDLPAKYRGLLRWYKDWRAAIQDEKASADPLLALAGTWSDLFRQESPDDYVRRLREGWD